jgi:hypothetical protein
MNYFLISPLMVRISLPLRIFSHFTLFSKLTELEMLLTEVNGDVQLAAARIADGSSTFGH